MWKQAETLHEQSAFNGLKWTPEIVTWMFGF